MVLQEPSALANCSIFTDEYQLKEIENMKLYDWADL